MRFGTFCTFLAFLLLFVTLSLQFSNRHRQTSSGTRQYGHWFSVHSYFFLPAYFKHNLYFLLQILFAAFAACFVVLASALKPLQNEERPVTGPGIPFNGPVGMPFNAQGPSKEEPNAHPRDKKFACKLSPLNRILVYKNWT